MKKTILAYAAGCFTVLAGIGVADAVSHIDNLPEASVASGSLKLEPMQSTLATVHSGTPNFRVAAFAQSSDQRTTAGVWAADGPSKFDWAYTTDEAVYIHEGQVDIEYQGKKFTLKPGDTAFFHAGTKATWSVPEHVRKSWTLHEAGRLVRWYRKLVGSNDGTA